jgi:hypothetical protein
MTPYTPTPPSRFATLLAFALVLALGFTSIAGVALASKHARELAKRAPTDPHTYVLDTLLAASVDREATPFTWVERRPLLRCGPRTTLRVNGESARPGMPLPTRPFEVEWRADRCMRLDATAGWIDGHVRMMVFREDWGFSAILYPTQMQVGIEGRSAVRLARGAAAVPPQDDDDLSRDTRTDE